MKLLLSFLPVLACIGLMYGCIKMMSRSHAIGATGTPDLEVRVSELEQELAGLRAERDVANREAGA